MPESKESSEGMLTACEDIIAAVNSKDAGRLMSALQSAFEMMEEMPHEEGPHINE